MRDTIELCHNKWNLMSRSYKETFNISQLKFTAVACECPNN